MGAETRVLTGCSGSAHSSPRLQTQGRLHEDESTGCPSPWVLLEQDHTHTHVQTLPGETGLLTGLPSEMRLQTAPCGVQGSSAHPPPPVGHLPGVRTWPLPSSTHTHELFHIPRLHITVRSSFRWTSWVEEEAELWRPDAGPPEMGECLTEADTGEVVGTSSGSYPSCYPVPTPYLLISFLPELLSQLRL